MLNSYLQTLQGFIRDRAQRNINPTDLISYINRARREIALRSQSVRVLTPVSGGIQNIQVTAGGTGYTNPTVVISAPDSPSGAPPFPAGAQAIATATQVGGVIRNISVDFGGDGYFQPTVTITDPTGTKATATATTNPINVTAAQQEIYQFSRAPLQTFPGVDSIFAVKSVSMIYANYRYSLPCYDFSTYQALIRQYPRQYLYVPTVFGQHGQGTAGTLYMYPIPSTAYLMEWDCLCLPSDLTTDQDPEIIPSPWIDAVPIGAAVYCYEELQNWNTARYYQEKFDSYCHRYSQYARPGRATNLNGRF